MVKFVHEQLITCFKSFAHKEQTMSINVQMRKSMGNKTNNIRTKCTNLYRAIYLVSVDVPFVLKPKLLSSGNLHFYL